MTGLKSFIISEETRLQHAERYLMFIEQYDEQVFLAIKQSIEDVWRSRVVQLSKKHPAPEEAVQNAIFQNPKATTQLIVDVVAEKIITSRARDPMEVAPFVKIPFTYSSQERHAFVKQLVKDAKEIIENIANKWKPILNYEKDGRLTPWFKISHDDDEVRFQLSLGAGAHESYKTLYAVRTEYGKIGSKLKDFDRVYLVKLSKG